jgi:endonuclease/exonuclease/phosphatase family metal-dependent hydrolase
MPLDRWCAGVGPVVSLVQDAPEPVLDSLPVISWNTHVGGGDLAGLVRDLRAGKLTDGQSIEHFVLLLQEVYREGLEVPRNPSAMAPRRIFASPEGQPRIDSTPDLTPEDRGNAILSTLPLTDLGAIELPYEIQRRVVAAANVTGRTSTGEPWQLRVMSVHLDHRSRNGRVWQSFGGGRARQARALVEALDPDHATVLGGDLNTWSLGALEGAIGVLEQHFPVHAGHTPQPTFGTASGLGGMTLDRLLFRLPEPWSGMCRRIDDRYGSDHHPVIGWVRLIETPETTRGS